MKSISISRRYLVRRLVVLALAWITLSIPTTTKARTDTTNGAITTTISVAGSPHRITAKNTGETNFIVSTSSALLQEANQVKIYLPLILKPSPPTNLALSSTSFPGNVPVGALVGKFTTTDPDTISFKYSLISGAGSDNNAEFTISGDRLLTAAVFDFNVKNNYSIRVRTTDDSGLWFEKPFTITVTANANPPTVPFLLAPENNAFVANTTPTLTWGQSTVPAGSPAFDHYWVQIWIVSGDIAVTKVDVHVPGISNTSYTVPTGELVANTKYYWGVRSVNIFGQVSAWPTVLSFQTP